MKNVKRLAAISLAVIMMLCMSITAFYADDEATTESAKRTIQVTNPKKSDHVYEAYQVFSGKVTEDGEGENKTKTITDIKWGNGVNGDDLLTALKGDETVGDRFNDAESAADVANVLNDIKTADDSAALDAVAALIEANVTGTSASSAEPTSEEAPYVYNIEVEGDGYYFVKDSSATELDEHDAVTKFILQVAGESKVEVNVKTDFPDIDKKIVEGNDRVDANNVSIGDTVTYEVTSKVPDMTHYKTYFFQVQDTMEEGLTLNEDSFQVTIGGVELSKDAYEVKTPDGDYTFTLRIKEFIQYKKDTGADIVITYDAVLNENAEIGTDSNDNTVSLKFSNNPNQSDGGETNPNEPNPTNPTGETPKHTVKTYTSAIKVLKLDGATQKPLAGVEFTIEGEGVNVVLITEEKFVADAEGTFYKLTDGTYTTTEPTEDTAELYDSTETKYKKTVEAREKLTNTGDGVKATVNDDGIVEFTGLGAGTYTIKETNMPKGYQKIEDVEVVISFDTANEKWSAEATGPKELLDSAMTDGVVELKIENNVTVELPSTGGSGVVMFYVIGGILVAGAFIALIALRKRSAK